MTEELEGAIREVVHDFVSETTLQQLEHPEEAAQEAASDPELSRWYASLPEDGKTSVRKLMKSVVDETIHGVLGVLDDVCDIDDRLPEDDPLDVAFVVDDAGDPIL